MSNENVILFYGDKAWQLIPKSWRYWWIDTLGQNIDGYENISIDLPEPIIVDRTQQLYDWKLKIDSNMLFEISEACNKYMVPTVMCPWGCNEFIFRSGFISIGIVFERYLRKVSLIMIHDLIVMKYVSYCREDYIQFNNDYDCLLLNRDSWKVMPSVCLRNGYGAQVMTCKDHDKGCPKCMIHPPRQPQHILSSKYPDQICHAVIKPRTVSTSKANKYSNTYKMHEQRGNFNGIDTCSITQYRKFKLLSYLLHENELRSLKGRADINALLTQLVQEKELAPDIVKNYRKLAEKMTLKTDELSYGATYVPIDIAVNMGLDKARDVFWDVEEPTEKRIMTPCFPAYVHPIQTCNEFGSAPHSLPLLMSTGRNASNTSMLWLLCGLLIRIQELWTYAYKMPLFQSKWNGWLLTYLSNKLLHHYSQRSKSGDSFSMLYVSSIEKLSEKLVSNIYILYF